MSTFLELCNAVGRETGTLGQDLTTVTGVTGRSRKIVGWTRQAWEIIQLQRQDWRFRRKQFDDVLSIGETTYNPEDLGIADFGGWLEPAEGWSPFTVYDSTIGKADETPLHQLDIREWMSVYDLGAPESMRPRYYCVDQDDALRIGPAPDKRYVVRGWYQRGLQSLELDGDLPFIRPEFHAAIVWRACMLAGDDDEAAFEVASSTAQFRQFHEQMLKRYVDKVQI